MIQAMRKKPKTTPATTAPPASFAGMPKTASARAMAMTMPENAATQTRALRATSTKKRVTTGRAATAVDSGHAPRGS